MNKSSYVLGIGPMSIPIINCVYSYSHVKKTPLMLIASKNQVDYKSGYVSNTKQFSSICSRLKKKYPESNVLLCRDHCGPGFNGVSNLNDVYNTIDYDIDNNFDLIHIDFSNLNDHKEILFQSKRAIEYIFKKSKKIKLEIGTDSIELKNFHNISKIENEMIFFSSFCQPDFFVCQTGSLVKEIEQVGEFDKEYVSKLSILAQKYNLIIKEHNSDYLNASEIRKRNKIIGAMNIAPQLGVIQTFLTINKALLYGININSFLEDSYNSRKWEKWMNTNNWSNKLLCSIVSGHYNFDNTSYLKILKQINKHENFYESLEIEVFNLLDLYINNLNTKE